MKKRKKIGLFFVFDLSTNSGIVNYLCSMIKALNIINNQRKPELIIFYSKNAPIEMIKAEKYPFISYKNVEPMPSIGFFLRVMNKVARIIIGRNLLNWMSITSKDADYVFPFPMNSYFDRIKGKVHWLVDFNPYYFPNHLSKEQREYFFDHCNHILYSTDKVVVSSFAVLNDIKKFHPEYTCKIEILRFAVLLGEFKHIDVNEVKLKYGISKPYFMTPNQFWVHKNHKVLLKSAVILKKRGVEFQMVFTGSTTIESDTAFYPSLLAFIVENRLQSEIKILGIVNRSHQLALMSHSHALVQPSLFEGWSTLVEESKALGKHIVLSDIAVHREQIDLNCTFFDALNEENLADILEALLKNKVEISPLNYKLNIEAFAERIIEIFN